jgi:hypothetical protein
LIEETGFVWTSSQRLARGWIALSATAYTAYVKTIDRLSARLHANEAQTLRHAADSVFFDEEDRDEAVAAATRLIIETLAHDERLGPDAAEALVALLDGIEPALVST